MKKLFALAALSVMLAACGSTTALLPASGASYSVALSSLGYELTPEGRIIIPSVTATLTTAAGTRDIYNVTYTATLLDFDGRPVAGATETEPGNSQIVPARGQLFTYGRGGYSCTTTPTEQCRLTSPDANFVANTTAASVSRAIVPGEWAVAQIAASQANPTTQAAAWQARFDFQGQVSGQTVSWTQYYQFTNPAR